MRDRSHLELGSTEFRTPSGVRGAYLPKGGWLLHNVMSAQEQETFYGDTIARFENVSVKGTRAVPLAMHNLVYLSEEADNCPKEVSSRWLAWGNDLLRQLGDLLPADNNLGSGFNSFYMQLYGIHGTMAAHRDQHVSWGLSLSLGASCDFDFGGTVLTLRSGDVLLADFSAVEHAVLGIHSDCPAWLHDERDERARASVQLRYVEGATRVGMSAEEFHALLRGGS